MSRPDAVHCAVTEMLDAAERLYNVGRRASKERRDATTGALVVVAIATAIRDGSADVEAMRDMLPIIASWPKTKTTRKEGR